MGGIIPNRRAIEKQNMFSSLTLLLPNSNYLFYFDVRRTL